MTFILRSVQLDMSSPWPHDRTISCSKVQHTCPYLTTKGHCSLSRVPWSRRTRLNLHGDEDRAATASDALFQCQPLKSYPGWPNLLSCFLSLLSSLRSPYRNTTFSNPTPEETSLHPRLSSSLVGPPPLTLSLPPSIFSPFLRGIRSNPAVVNLIPLIQLI